MAKLTIERKKELVDQYRFLALFLDGEKIGEIKNGKIMEFDIPAGNHSIYCKVQHCTSKELFFDITEHRGKTFTIGTCAEGRFRKMFVPLYYSLFKSDDYLRMEKVL